MLSGGICWATAGGVCYIDPDSVWNCNYPQFAGSLSYAVSVLIQIYDWHALRRSGVDAIYARKLLLTHSRGRERALLSFDYYLASNVLFLVGIVGDTLTTYAGTGRSTLDGSISYLVTSVLWLVSSTADAAQVLVDRWIRRKYNATIQVSERERERERAASKKG